MDANRLLPEVRKAVTRVPRLPFGRTGLNWLARSFYNLAASTKPLTGKVAVQDLDHNGRTHRIISPKEPPITGAAALWFHGGGYLAGKPSHLDSLGSLLANELGVTFVAPQYRLAPKHPYPAGLDDAEDSWRWLIEGGVGDIDPSRIAIGGNSAGAGLAAALVHRLHDQGGPQPSAQVLFYPMLDDCVAADRSLDEEDHFIWNNRQNYAAWSAYVTPHSPGSAAVPPEAAPARRVDLSGLPPTWIGQCALDLFARENEAYASRLSSSGVKCEVAVVEGAPHAFEVLVPGEDVARAFVRSAVDFLRPYVSSDQ